MLTSVQFIPGPQVFVQKSDHLHRDLEEICHSLHISPTFALADMAVYVSVDEGDSWDSLRDLREMRPYLEQLLALCPK